MGEKFLDPKKYNKMANWNFFWIESDKNFEIIPNEVVHQERTTLMIKNIPNKYTKKMMMDELDKKFKKKYDFFYLPIDF